MIDWPNKKYKKSPSMLAIYWPIIPLWILMLFAVLITPKDWPQPDTVWFDDWTTPRQRTYEVLSYAMSLLPFVIIIPVIEELLFRKFLWWFSSLLFWNFERGNIITFWVVTLLFALAHRDPAHIIAVMPLSFALGYLRLKTGSVKPCIIVHAAYNLSAALFPFLPLLWV